MRARSGKYCYGKTPLQTFMESAKLAIDKQLDRFARAAEPVAASAEPACLSDRVLGRTNYAGRDALVCVHGNRFIQWAAFRGLAMNPGDAFAGVSGNVQAVVAATVAKVVAGVKSAYPESYPASLFKNLGKCRALAAKVT